MPERLAITRYDLAKFVTDQDYDVGAEVGVQHGAFSYYLLRHSTLNVLHSIDSWAGKWCKLREDAASLLKEFGDRSAIHVQTSRQAAEEFSRQKTAFDFVYIDADHRYKAVRDDLRLWWPLLNRGGLFAGHDYCDAGAGVVQAVDEFVAEHNLKLFLTRETWASWLILK